MLRASISASVDELETGLLSNDILACFEEALGDRLPEMGTDAASCMQPGEIGERRECGGRAARSGGEAKLLR